MAVQEKEPKEVKAPSPSSRHNFVGRAHKIKIMPVPGELPYWDLTLGDLPKIRVWCNKEAIVPIEYLSVLDDTVVDSFRDVALAFPDPETGNVFKRVPHSHQRSPYQDYGEVPWSEWEKAWAKSTLTK